MRKMIKVATVIITLGMMVGCEPDEITVHIPVSAIEMARKGEVAYLKARATGKPEHAPDSIIEKKDHLQ